MENEIKDSICTKRLPVKVNFWCDNFANLYIGHCGHLSAKSLASFDLAANGHHQSVAIESHVTCCDYLYFVCWSDDSTQNGFLAQVNSVVTNANDWEVFATGINYDSDTPAPSRDEVLEQIEKANCHHYWKRPTEGPQNIQNLTISSAPVAGISPNANFIWFDTGLDTSSGTPAPPFNGFNHDEFLIFRLSVKKIYRECTVCDCEDCDCCNCGCDGCNERAGELNKVLEKRAKGKTFVVPGSANGPLCTPPYKPAQCTQALAAKKLNLCFHLHWGDGTGDQIETSDTEVVYLTVCNPYADLKFKGLRIIKLTIIPARPISQIQLVPDSFICFDCIDPCSCKSRELALLTRNVPPGAYTIEVEYCVDEIEVTSYVGGKTTFPITIIQD